MYSDNEMILWSLISTLTKKIGSHEFLKFDSKLLFKVFNLSIISNTNLFKANKSIKKIFFDTFEQTRSLIEISNFFFLSSNIKKLEEKVKYELEILKLKNISYITYCSKFYPNNLKKISNPPYVIFYQGNIELLYRKAIAIIGTREPSENFNLFLTDTLKIFSKNNIALISGLAKGCDTLAHHLSLNFNISNIAILGQGLSREIYPQENKNLKNKIIKEGGIIISEIPPSYPVKSIYLLQRNRLQVGFCDMILVLETREKGGTIHTIKIAKKEKKPVLIRENKEHKKIFITYKNIIFLKNGYEIDNYISIHLKKSYQLNLY